MEDLLETLPTSYFNGAVNVATSPCSYNTVYINWIETKEHHSGRGLGRAALEEICKWADENRVSLELSPNPYAHCPMDKKQIIQWYESFGFVQEMEHREFMKRRPLRLDKMKKV